MMVTLFLEEEGTGTLMGVPLEETAQNVARAAAEHVHCPFDIEVNLLLTDDENIRKMNAQFRQIDQSTDVLSFPLLSFEKAGDFSEITGEDGWLDPDTGQMPLGDIVISKERALQQAVAYGHSILREYAFLIAHSMLHLFGYDHILEEERTEMEQIQDEILTGLGITR